jgi:predicted DsbA family dithiol-disulfide isomerase
MRITVTYYLDVISSWCFWAEPAWAELKRRYQDKLEFQWKIALLDKIGLPTSVEQEKWFYRRSGTIMRSPFMLSSAWYDPAQPEYLAPNCVAEAAKALGVVDDRVRLALTQAGLREGKKFGEWEIAAEIGARAGQLDRRELLERARSPVIETRVRADTADFHLLQVTQRPTFVMDTEIGDRAVFSGFAKAPPLVTAIDSMLDDAEAYSAFGAHFGAPPA